MITSLRSSLVPRRWAPAAAVAIVLSASGCTAGLPDAEELAAQLITATEAGSLWQPWRKPGVVEERDLVLGGMRTYTCGHAQYSELSEPEWAAYVEYGDNFGLLPPFQLSVVSEYLASAQIDDAPTVFATVRTALADCMADKSGDFVAGNADGLLQFEVSDLAGVGDEALLLRRRNQTVDDDGSIELWTYRIVFARFDSTFMRFELQEMWEVADDGGAPAWPPALASQDEFDRLLALAADKLVDSSATG